MSEPNDGQLVLIDLPRSVLAGYFGRGGGTVLPLPGADEPGMPELRDMILSMVGTSPVLMEGSDHLQLRFALPRDRPALQRLYLLACAAETASFQQRPPGRPVVADDPGVGTAHALLADAATLAVATMRALYGFPLHPARPVRPDPYDNERTGTDATHHA